MYPVGEIAAIVGGHVLRDDGATPVRIVHDSRAVAEGDLFVALRGAQSDGHAFLADAFARGACSALVRDPDLAPSDARNLIVADDPLAGLQTLAAAWRRRLCATLVGITGSNGKTTTRALLAHLLTDPADPGAVFNAPKNYNTEIGLPLALLAMPEAALLGLFELGTERPGEIAALAAILAPKTGLITSIGPSHLSGFRTVEAVADEKWTLIEGLADDGVAFVNADSPELRRRAEDASKRVIPVGLDHGAIRGRLERKVPTLVLAIDEPKMRLECPLIGRHNASNLLLAAVTAARLGIPPRTIEERAKSFQPVPHRLQSISTVFGTILDDTYNANPASTSGALRALAQLGRKATQRVFIFGEMRDLGPEADRYHREIADLALDLGIDAILPVGETAISACRTRPHGAVSIVERSDLATAVRALCGKRESIVLVKGSRELELERLVAELVGSAS